MYRGRTIEIISMGLLYLSLQFITNLNKIKCKTLTLFTSHKLSLSVTYVHFIKTSALIVGCPR